MPYRYPSLTWSRGRTGRRAPPAISGAWCAALPTSPVSPRRSSPPCTGDYRLEFNSRHRLATTDSSSTFSTPSDPSHHLQSTDERLTSRGRHGNPAGRDRLNTPVRHRVGAAFSSLSAQPQQPGCRALSCAGNRHSLCRPRRSVATIRPSPRSTRSERPGSSDRCRQPARR